MDNKKVTSLDVAKLAGVSQSTVSRVFGMGANVSDSKRNKILLAAEKLGYQPNAIARGLITNKTRMIGIVMRDIKNPFYPEVLEKFYKRLSKQGYYLIFINSENDRIEENEINQLIEYHVEGVIITDAFLSSSAVERFVKNNITVILFNRYTENQDCSAVFCDNYQAGRQIGNYLVERGHKSFAFISGPINTSTTRDRKRGFEDALRENGIFNIVIEIGNYSYESGFEATRRVLQRSKKIDCIFCGNDITALGAIDAIKSMALKIPEDISVVGFDDISMAKWPSYSLTTWQQPIDKMIDSTINLLLNAINQNCNEIVTKAITGILILRDSTK